MTRALVIALALPLFAACATTGEDGTLAELAKVEADVEEVHLADSLERAAQSYRRYLAETAEGPRTPEAMRRLADLQLEQEYGVLGGGGAVVEMAAPATAAPVESSDATLEAPQTPAESLRDFERRVSREALLAGRAGDDLVLPGGASVPAGPREAIATYWKILESYPGYERSDQVLYQLSRAYDEIGEPDEAMKVMDRLVSQFPESKFVDEVFFRRGEYYFVRKKYLDAEDAYGAIVGAGEDSGFYELALYKLGWTFYKQELYEEALQNFVAMLDHRQAVGHDFDAEQDTDDTHRVEDTFRVISLSFSNLGGPEVVDEYFSEHGHRPYGDKIYANLGEFYFAKLRYDDAASVYKSFIALNPLHKVSPHFSMRVVEIYVEAGFPKLVVEAKKEFATVYALDATYWQHFDVAEATEVVGFLKTNLTDLAAHYHSLYQDEEALEERPENFVAARHWYREFLDSFPADEDTPQINYQLADLLLENEDFADAAREYERTAYDYAAHEQAAEAGYAAIYAHRQNLERRDESGRPAAMLATVDSSLRFAETFQDHEQAAVVLGAAADDLYVMQDFARAIAAARTLIDRYPEAGQDLRRSAWAVVAHSSIDLSAYEDAEVAYQNVLALTAEDDPSRTAVVDGLAAAIYKQGEVANAAGDFRTAAGHFLRVKDAAPGSAIRTAADYDAAAALIKLKDWTMASGVLEEFRASHPEHDLNSEATKQLAYIYREDGQLARSAAEYERIAAEAGDPALSSEALLTAGELYDEVGQLADAVRVYESYVAAYPEPLDIAMQTRSRLAEIFKEDGDDARYLAELHNIVAADRNAGAARTDRSRFLAAKAALVLAQRRFEGFAAVRLTQPFELSLVTKQQSMDDALAAFDDLLAYEVAETTAAATYYMAEIYLDFSRSLLESERPAGLSAGDLADYEMALEEEAYPFEEQAIEVHEQNFELLTGGVYNPWVQDSVSKLAELMPGRYAKAELSGDFVGAGDLYAYRMPVAPPEGTQDEGEFALTQAESSEPEPDQTVQDEVAP